jgi:hypothetical protein
VANIPAPGDRNWPGTEEELDLQAELNFVATRDQVRLRDRNEVLNSLATAVANVLEGPALNAMVAFATALDKGPTKIRRPGKLRGRKADLQTPTVEELAAAMRKEEERTHRHLATVFGRRFTNDEFPSMVQEHLHALLEIRRKYREQAEGYGYSLAALYEGGKTKPSKGLTWSAKLQSNLTRADEIDLP